MATSRPVPSPLRSVWIWALAKTPASFNRESLSCLDSLAIPVEVQHHGLVEHSLVQPGGAVSKFEAALSEPVRRVRVNLMFQGLDSSAKLIRRLPAVDGESALQYARTPVEFLGDEMHCAAMPCIAGIEHSLMGIEPRVGRQ